MSGLDPRIASVDADLLARRNTRLLLGALAERAGLTLLIGEQVLAETKSAIGRIAGARGNLPRLLDHFEAWLEPMRMRGVVDLVDHEELHGERRQRAELHAWLHDTWQRLKGDPNDEEHVSVALARNAAAVFTSNMTCIDSDLFLTEAAEAELAMPRVLKRDRVLDHFSYLLNYSSVELLESALLPNLTAHPDLDLRLMVERLAQSLRASFPAARLETLGQLRTHEEYLALTAEYAPAPTTGHVLESTQPSVDLGGFGY